MSVLNSNDIARIDAIRADMEKRGCDIQRNVWVGDRNIGFVTRFGKSGKYHFYTLGVCAAMLRDARGLYDYMQSMFPGWELKKL